VIEAIVEELDAKRALFGELEEICRGDAVLATNTSALSVTEIAAATGTPERVVGMHFFNPAPLMPLVEVVRAELSSDGAVARLTTTSELSELSECDLVIEAIVEELDAKRARFAELERICRADAVLATNTSALSVTEIAAATETPERVVGMHFFNPAPLMPLVEVARAQLSADEAVAAALAVVERLGKVAVPCHDTPGFVVNRVLIPLLNDCVRVLDEARVTPESLDAAMTNGAGWPMGPCTLLDLVGIDVHVHASEALYEKLREPRMAPPPRIVGMRNAGLLGRKSGRGFYGYG
jgi:3-hydroxybutyryl-CoA dehydrogenase